MASTLIVQLSFVDSDVAILTLDDRQKGVNILGRDCLAELAEHLDALEARTDLAGLIIRSGKPENFIAGADLREFLAWIDADPQEVASYCRQGQQLFGRLAQLPFVTVAAIGGVCVGGGAELAVWCDRRVMTRGLKPYFGFPEVKLGLFPGWGGTARMPRMVGLSLGIEAVTGGALIDAKAASLMGLADDVVEKESLDEAAMSMVRTEQISGQYRHDRRRWSAPIVMSETELSFLGVTASAYIQQQTKGHYPAPAAALELMLGASAVDLEQACQMETEAFVGLFGSPANRALLNVFFLQDANKKDTGVEGQEVVPQPISSVGVAGAGIMGQGIAAANLKRNVLITMNDVSEEALTGGIANVLREVSYNKELRGPDVERTMEFAPLLKGSTCGAELTQCDLVIEAVVEDQEIKRQVLAQLESHLEEHAVLASNTSTIPITRLASGLARPEKFCGIHFFNPVRKMPLVEVIRGEKTSDQTVATAVAYAKRLQKSAIVVQDGPGFLVNRLLLPYMNEALELILDGASIREVERAAKSFGMPMGPITLFDVVGLDTALQAGRVMYEAFPDRVVASELLAALYKRGRLGQKSGAGFFRYDLQSKLGQVDPDLEPIVEERRRGAKKFTQQQLTERLFLPMLVEATRVLQDGLVRGVRDVDLGLIYGIGFPPFKGGLLFWADTLGVKRILEMLAPYVSLGKRYQPTEMLQEMVRGGRTFYE